MFIRLDDEELEYQVGMFFAQAFFPFYDISRALEHSLEISGFSVLGIDILCGTIYGNDEAVESGEYGFSGIFFVEEMTIGRGNSIDPPGVGIADHFEKFRIDIGFSLEIKNEEEEILM